MSRKQKYETEIVLGRRYLDTQTGIEGHATAIAFFQHGCERATLEVVVQGKIEEYSFDTPRLVDVETQHRATTLRTGGPRPSPSRTGVRPESGHAAILTLLLGVVLGAAVVAAALLAQGVALDGLVSL